MIIVVEGPSAAAKSTWIAAHCQSATVIGEAPSGPAPGRTLDPDGAAAHWATISAARWHAAGQAEQRTGTAVCDTGPLKLHYVWSLWQTWHASRRQWHAELTATRRPTFVVMGHLTTFLCRRWSHDDIPAAASQAVAIYGRAAGRRPATTPAYTQTTW